jgi:hypothetical protein
MSPEHPIFRLSFPAPSFRAATCPRAVLMALVTIGYLVVAGALLLLQILFIETMPPPKAATGPVIIFHPPSLETGGGAGERRGRAPATSTAMPPVIHPPDVRPTVVPLPPPVDDRTTEVASPSTPGLQG